MVVRRALSERAVMPSIDFYVNAMRDFGTACRPILTRVWTIARPHGWNSQRGCAFGVTMREYYSITELTREFDVSTRTLRFYEDEGLVQPVRRGRTRLFRPSDRHLIRQIMRGKRLGFSINEIREIIQMY
ncbi:MAG: MerR family transcriptional regulator, partial [Mesorhizobium sp.]